MNFEINKLLPIRATAFFILMVVILLAGCASNQMATKQTEKGAVESITSKLITQITTTEDPEAFSVWIKGNRLLTYTSVKQPVPLGVLLYFPETALRGDINTTYMPESDLVGSINASELTDKGHTSRIEIALKQDASYEVIRQDNDLKIVFKKVSAAAETQTMPAAASTAVAVRLESISLAELADSINIFVNADGTIKDYKFFTTTNPARIIFDLFGVQSAFKKEQTIPVGSQWVKTIRHYGYPDRVRVVLDTTARYLSAVSANSSETGLVIQVGSTTKTAAVLARAEMRAEASTGEIIPLEVDDSKPAWVNRIDFSSEEAGKSTIIIGTTKPIQYKIKKLYEKKLLLTLFNTNIPEYRQRPLITTRFASAVDRITPFQTPKTDKNSMISIELRESVPYVAEQVGDLLMLHFEASSIPPKTLDEAKLPPWKKVSAQAMAATEAVEPAISAIATAAQQPSGKYTGEKIALNFYQTDIKNVFRILMDVSKKNFAIDKDVSGSVTLTFDKPVPWDQVLDLILRMNMLGMIYDGDIVRIATQKTLEKEATQRQAELAAQQKATTQKEAAEPLLTEFIPVNYADAGADVLPHIVLTEGRGSITVDVRNNQIIITDVAAKIKQAKETVAQIDKVTPQVLIEARIVDADSTFSRDLGTSWSAYGKTSYSTTTPSYKSKLDGNLGFDMSSSNLPATNLGMLGFSLFRNTGASISVINAKIQAAESRGLTKIISSPKILTLDNTPATIKQGLQYPYNKLDADGNTTTEFFDVVLELTVTPHVTSDNRISMKIKVTNNEMGAVYNNQQSFKSKEIETELLVNDGDTIVIGGIRKSTKTDDVGGVPGLKDIPLLGWLFKSEYKQDNLTELLIFITPRIIRLEQLTSG
ncbi:MAG: type IV pilus secretin PilQ [Candidatus Desulfatibia sp.]|uniref:type IV pilus secretin PilQ n=1 Tax=Candidatus Desulfatibia sp. TaxID=3101189 RepID=UPI002F31E8D8